jgi:hypothetical protein
LKSHNEKELFLSLAFFFFDLILFASTLIKWKFYIEIRTEFYPFTCKHSETLKSTKYYSTIQHFSSVNFFFPVVCFRRSTKNNKIISHKTQQQQQWGIFFCFFLLALFHYFSNIFVLELKIPRFQSFNIWKYIYIQFYWIFFNARSIGDVT